MDDGAYAEATSPASVIKEEYHMSAKFDSEKLYARLAGSCQALGWRDGITALSFARDAHAGQLRKDGQPYFIHPMTVAAHSLALGIREEPVFAACILHDVCEDCNVQSDALPVSGGRIKDAVRRLTHEKGVPLDVYYRHIAEDPAATLAKVLDRCDNVSSMAGVFSRAKTLDYIRETRDHVLPLIASAKRHWPMYSDALFVIKYHIVSVVDGLEACLSTPNQV